MTGQEKASKDASPPTDKAGTAHSVLMDRIYRHQRHIYNLTRKYYLFGRDRLIRRLAPHPGESLVEIGCGTARNLIMIAKRYPELRLFGLDASHEMLHTAAEAVARAGLSDRIRLEHGYAEALSPAMFGESASFDHAVFSYSLSMIPDWKQAVKAAGDALAPEGRAHVVDFGDLEGLGPGKGLIMTWLRLFHVAPRVELLHAFEKELPDSVHILFGRYAFYLTIKRARLVGISG